MTAAAALLARGAVARLAPVPRAYFDDAVGALLLDKLAVAGTAPPAAGPGRPPYLALAAAGETLMIGEAGRERAAEAVGVGNTWTILLPLITPSPPHPPPFFCQPRSSRTSAGRPRPTGPSPSPFARRASTWP